MPKPRKTKKIMLEIKPKNKTQQPDMSMSEDTTPARQPTVPKTRKGILKEKQDIQKLRKEFKDKKKPLTPKQKELDLNKNNRLDSGDFEALRKKKPVVAGMTGGQIVSMMYDD